MSAGNTRFSAVVLAAGTSSRMEGRHKMLLPIGDEPAIRRTVRMVVAARPQEVVVVTGFRGHAVTDVLKDLPIRLQDNPRYEEGQMTSVAAGIAALNDMADVVMVCLGDMVLLTPADYREVVGAFASVSDKSILVPMHRGQRGNPVLFDASYLPEVVSGRRNINCRKLIADNPGDVFAYESDHDRFVTDMDTLDDYTRVLHRLGFHRSEVA